MGGVDVLNLKEVIMKFEAVHKTVVNIRKKVHPQCVVCSFGNARGLHLKFEVENDGSVVSEFECDESFEGYKGILHGGVISSILDGAMGNCIFVTGHTAVTVEMNTRFRHPIEIFKKAIVRARIVRVSSPLYLMAAEIIQDGKVKASAKAKFYDSPKIVNGEEG